MVPDECLPVPVLPVVALDSLSVADRLLAAFLSGRKAETIKAYIGELLVTLRQRDHELESVRARLDQLLRRLYGPRAERINADQLLLFADVIPFADVVPSAAASPPAGLEPRSPSPAPRSDGRRQPPRQLPRLRVTHEVPEAERLCPHSPLPALYRTRLPYRRPLRIRE